MLLIDKASISNSDVDNIWSVNYDKLLLEDGAFAFVLLHSGCCVCIAFVGFFYVLWSYFGYS